MDMIEMIARIQKAIDEGKYSLYISKDSQVENTPSFYIPMIVSGKREACELESYLPVPYKIITDITGKDDAFKYSQYVSSGDWVRCLRELPLGVELKLPDDDIYYYKQLRLSKNDFLWTPMEEVDGFVKMYTV